MSKIFCEICGTAYATTASQCPICGCPKPDSAEFSTETDTYVASESRTAPVKGGRFAPKNVNKRLSANAGQKIQAAPRKAATAKNQKKKKTSSAERALIITIVCLLLAIVAVMAYIIINYLVPRQPQGSGTPTPTETTLNTDPEETTVPPTTQPLVVPCTGITMTEESVVFDEIGKTWLLSAVPIPADTTDTVSYITSNPQVATVSATGLVTAVGEGTCTITVTCGEFSVSCQVVCELPRETEPTETTQPVDLSSFKLNREDFTLTVGESWVLYNGDIDPTLINWKSSNDRVATVINGTVKGVGRGMCMINDEYMGITLECVVYVN